MAKHTGILSDDDRAYLLGQKEYDGENAGQKENQKRYRIRKKVINALNDLEDLDLYLEDDDKEMIFSNAELAGVQGAIRFIYDGIRGSEAWVHGEHLRGAIADVEDRYAPAGVVVDRVDITFSYTETEPDVDKLRERIEKGVPLTDSEVGRLVRVGAITPEELDEITWDREEFDLDDLEWERSSSLHPREN